MNKILLSILVASTTGAGAATIQVNNTLLATDVLNYHYINGGATTLAVGLKTGVITTAGGTASNVSGVTLGTLYRVGLFNGLDATKMAILSNEATKLSDVLSMFTPLGTGVATSTLGTDNTANFKTTNTSGVDRTVTSFSGVTYSTDPANVSSAATGVGRGTRLFMLMVDSTTSINGDPADVASELGEKWTLISADDWLIPATGTANTVLAVKNVDTPAEVFHGRLGSIVLTNSFAGGVPEPSMSILALFGAVVGLRRRR